MIKRWLNNFYWYCNESNECFTNNKNEIVGIVNMYSHNPIKYFLMNLFYKKTNNIIPTKEDYIRLYSSKEIGDMVFYEDINFEKVDEKDTIGYLIKN